MYRVLKFGGSSVASATNISRVLDIVGKETAKGCVVLVSSHINDSGRSLRNVPRQFPGFVGAFLNIIIRVEKL